MSFLERQFRITERDSTVGRELLGGLTTFVTLSYIIFVNPAIMAAAGVPRGGAFVATCIASAVACLLMGLLANYPIALAPAMGHNAYFTYVVVLGMGLAWQQGLAAVFIGGCVFLAFSFFGFRARLMEFIPDNLKRAIAGGIGLLITLIGLEYGGIVVGSLQTGVKFGDVRSPVALLTLFGLGVTLVLLALKVRGAVLFGILSGTLAGLVATVTGVTVNGDGLLNLGVESYGALEPTSALLKLDFGGLFSAEGAATVILTFLFLDVFDTVGTLIGVSERAGLLDKEGRLPQARWALFSDASGTVVGALMGTSTITSYVESAAGVQAGARTGLASIVTAVLFVLSILVYPVLAVVATSHQYVADGFQISQYPVLAPALIVVGSMMLKSLARIDWEDPTEFLPAFLTVVLMPLTVSVTEGIAFGFIAYSVLKLVTGRGREVHWAFHLVALILLARYAFGLSV
jgi:AGZA family xanthine/uracil permease-like MFS transporter